MPYRRTRSSVWWVSYTDPGGKRVSRSTGTTDRREAAALEAKWKLASYRARQWEEQPEAGFEEVMLAFLQAHTDKRSADMDKLHARQLRTSLAGAVMDRLSAKAVSEHVRRRRQEGVGPASINRELALLSAAINFWNLEHDANLPNPVRGRKLREPEGRLRWLTRPEAAGLIAAAGETQRAPYLASLIVLALNTGMRREEMLGLEWSRVDLENGLIYLEARHTKAARRRTVAVNEAARDALLVQERFRATDCPATPWVFCQRNGLRVRSVAGSFGRACGRAQIENFRFHDLRHTCAAWLVQAGVSLTQVRDVLGHSTVVMTERYAHLAPENVRQALETLDIGKVTIASHQ